MKSIPVDTNPLQINYIEHGPKMRDERQIENADRELVWAVRCMVKNVNDDTKPELIEIAVPGPIDRIPTFHEVAVDRLTARHWSMGDRSGVSFSAAGVRTKVSSNGSKPTAPAAAAS